MDEQQFYIAFDPATPGGDWNAAVLMERLPDGSMRIHGVKSGFKCMSQARRWARRLMRRIDRAALRAQEEKG
jgi:hypothetical protein